MVNRDAEFKNRIKYKWEFLSRNSEYQDLKKGVKGVRVVEAELFRLGLFTPWMRKIKKEKLITEEEFRRGVRRIVVGLPSIEIIQNPGEESITGVPLSYLESHNNYLKLVEKWRKKAPDEFEKHGKFLLAINAIDKNDKTISIKIHLDRRKDHIRGDINYLLDILDKEAKHFGIELKKHKKRPPQKIDLHAETLWGAYDLYLRVWDLIEVAGKTPSEVARILFSADFADPKTLSEDAPEQNPESAIKKVVHYHKQAKKMIKGGWRQI